MKTSRNWRRSSGVNFDENVQYSSIGGNLAGVIEKRDYLDWLGLSVR
jgi:glycosidase